MMTVFLYFRKLFQHGNMYRNFDVQLLPWDIFKNFEMNMSCIERGLISIEMLRDDKYELMCSRQTLTYSLNWFSFI
jgi:hypothetical protein